MIRTLRLRIRAGKALSLGRSVAMSAFSASHGNQVVAGALSGTGAGLAMSFLGASTVDASSFGLAFAAAVVKMLSVLRRSSNGQAEELSTEEALHRGKPDATDEK
ncbi:hypothetical protein [Streptomyces sp. NPDC085937]|uniref:hypothetical protein n=1 Tax=Streptomyces sp. NPDC085937 TaxID=3365742 RepID=UPI0037D392C0